MPESFLNIFTTNLTAAATANPDNYLTIGRHQEIEQLVDNLSRKTKNNPLLIGEPGVGKTAIVDGLARLIALKKAGPKLNDKIIRVLQMAELRNPTVGTGDAMANFEQLIKELAASQGKIILFVDEAHMIMSTGDYGDVLKPAMARGEIQLIGCTTLREYHRDIEEDGALKRRFQVIDVPEPSAQETEAILTGIKGGYERFHHVTYSDAIVKLCVQLSMRYIPTQFLPDKAIDLLDMSGAVVSSQQRQAVTATDVAKVLEMMTHIPITSILMQDSERLRQLPSNLRQRVIGQDEAIKSVTDTVVRAKVGIQDPRLPLGSFFFMGMTGTGKTELAKALTTALFDNEQAMIRMDMSEFSLAKSVDRFQFQLTEKIKHQPYSVVTLDEFEKSNPLVQDRLLQVLGDGELSDEYGQDVDFRNCIIIMTSNIGYEAVNDQADFMSDEKADKFTIQRQKKNFKTIIQDTLTTNFRPEFVNRIGKVVVFNMLDKAIIRKIADKDLQELNVWMKHTGFQLRYKDDLLNFLADIGTDIKQGARPLARQIDQEVATPVSYSILSNKGKGFNVIRIHVSGHGEYGNIRGDRVVHFELINDHNVA